MHILLVDDDEDDRDFFKSVLASISPAFTCDTAGNGLIAMQHLRQTPNLPDIIFLDLNMPVMNGTQFLTEIKKQPTLNTIPVIMLTTSAEGLNISQTRALGASDFITKPTKLSMLEMRVREILANPDYYRKK